MQSGRYYFEDRPSGAVGVVGRDRGHVSIPRPAADQLHTHIHLPPGYGAAPPREGGGRDQPPRLREGRQRDQEGPPPGTLLCTLMQDGETGDWLGEDAEGNPLAVSSSGAGLEVRTRAPPREDGGGADQQRVAVNVPTQEFGEAAGNASEHDRRMVQRGRAARDEWIRTGRVRDEAALIGDYQRRINEHYQRR